MDPKRNEVIPVIITPYYAIKIYKKSFPFQLHLLLLSRKMLQNAGKTRRRKTNVHNVCGFTDNNILNFKHYLLHSFFNILRVFTFKIIFYIFLIYYLENSQLELILYLAL